MPEEYRPVFPKRWSTTVWVASAALFVALCYLFTFGLGLACVAFVVMGFTSFAYSPLYALIMGFCAIIGPIILWSVIPRRDHFQPPGARIELAHHPRLATEVRRIAAAFGQRLPDDIYVTGSVNAWVGQRGSILGLGGRRVMALGLPLMQVLSVSQFRAVLAHECAHYYGGDTRLGPWLYTSGSAIIRTLVNLTRMPGTNTIARFPFVGFIYLGLVTLLRQQLKLFLRISSLLSRRQEYRCDELACRLAGSEPFISGLKSIVGTTGLESLYWKFSVLPALQAGYRPPLAEGFQLLLDNRVAVGIKHLQVCRDMRKPTAAVYDRHPPLASRLSRMKAVNIPHLTSVREPAVSLLEELSEIEGGLARILFPDTPVDRATPLAWHLLGTTAFAPTWRRDVAAQELFFTGKKVGDLVEAAKCLPELAKSVRNPPGRLYDKKQRLAMATGLLTNALTLTMSDHGWQLYTEPGGTYLVSGTHQIYPSAIIQGIVTGTTTVEAWRELARSYGVEELPLFSPESRVQSAG